MICSNLRLAAHWTKHRRLLCWLCAKLRSESAFGPDAVAGAAPQKLGEHQDESPASAETGQLRGFFCFHMDINGGPFSYKWINSNPLPKIWEQMNLAIEYGATRIWIANLGDLKPLEIPLEFFIRTGWDPKAVSKDKIADYQRR